MFCECLVENPCLVQLIPADMAPEDLRGVYSSSIWKSKSMSEGMSYFHVDMTHAVAMDHDVIDDTF